ncbi:dual specificity protein phosphatase 18 isoform X2 [Amphiprion ocellaris]|uniref:Protein-tyrosine-phosphatase n=1 Tax=Amphiprion ocellaris TaxID=80972 RepID=A0AAQ6A6W0_AMPOC|nr:dual specificity protein phosphatase 18 isoform X2 [Amphiprion ocellaris]
MYGVCVCVCVCVSLTAEEQQQMAVSQITPTLFLGGADAPLNAALMSQKGITLIVNATLSHACPAYPGVECVRVPVSDLPSARLGDHFDRVAERIHGNRAGSTLVHCAAGMSRSPALIMAYLMRFRGVTLRQAHHWVQDRRPAVRLNAGFWEQLLLYERRLYGKNTVRVEEEPPHKQPPRTPRSSMVQSSRLTAVPRSPLMSQSPLMSRSQLLTSENRRQSKSSHITV